MEMGGDTAKSETIQSNHTHFFQGQGPTLTFGHFNDTPMVDFAGKRVSGLVLNGSH